jgi:hypothetical protein
MLAYLPPGTGNFEAVSAACFSANQSWRTGGVLEHLVGQSCMYSFVY